MANPILTGQAEHFPFVDIAKIKGLEFPIIFTTEYQLQKLTGLSHEELWDNGFDLDDWDVGFCMKESLKNNWLHGRMKNYCCGYKVCEYNGIFYYLVYHA